MVDVADALDALVPGAAGEVRRAFAAGGDSHVRRDVLESVRGFLAGDGGVLAQAVRLRAGQQHLGDADRALRHDDTEGALRALARALEPLERLAAGLAGPRGDDVRELRALVVAGAVFASRAAVRVGFSPAALGLLALRGPWGVAAWGAWGLWQAREVSEAKRNAQAARTVARLAHDVLAAELTRVERALHDVLGGVLHDTAAAVPRGGA